ncbi:MAG TPA: enoyl-CoA hydratase [Candidatus Dormibacteraeota bacterium]|nr:enoyl-CoA hydratase [Candidatus Dormibacteraeota bacterium]
MLIKYETIKEHIAVITINRPEVSNALSTQLIQAINHTFEKIAKHPSIYCTIITGAQDKTFCAGADLKERLKMTEKQVVETVREIGKMVSGVERLPMPVIAALNGVAFGGGLELALACDLRIAADHIKLGLTETSLGIIPGAGGTQRLPRLVGTGQAKRMIYTAQPIGAKEALEIGLVEKVVKSTDLLYEAVELAELIASNGPIAIRQAKNAINTGMQTDLATGLSVEHESYQQTIHTRDRLEGLRAFQEKRKPNYKGQ